MRDAEGERRCGRMTFMKADATRIGGHVRYTWIASETEKKNTSRRRTKENRVTEMGE